MQQFDGGISGQPAVICALFGHAAVAVDQEIWNALGQFGRGTYVSGVAAVGFPVASGERPYIAADGRPVELAGGEWGPGRLVPVDSGGWRWQPAIVFDSEACRDQDTWSARRGEMDLRLRLAIRMLLVAEGLRITEVGRTRMLGELATPAQILSKLQITPGELVRFFTSGWPTAEALVLTTGNQGEAVPPAGPSRLELYIQNRHPSGTGGERVLRTEDLVDLSVFGRTRKSQLRDLSVGVTAPLGLSAEEIGSLVRQALKQMASDFGFTAAETAQL